MNPDKQTRDNWNGSAVTDIVRSGMPPAQGWASLVDEANWRIAGLESGMREQAEMVEFAAQRARERIASIAQVTDPAELQKVLHEVAANFSACAGWAREGYLKRLSPDMRAKEIALEEKSRAPTGQQTFR